MRSKPEKPRIICIGWHKTGTSTMGTALLKLGYSVLGARLDAYYPLAEGDVSGALAIAHPFDAVQDVPWAALFREFDARYPGSKFILTVRDEESWLASATRHFGDTPRPLFAWLYGKDRLKGNEQLYLERFRKHYIDARAYFESRPEDFLEFDLAGGDGWEKLCSFLDEPVPTVRFPHENQAPERAAGLRKSRLIVRNWTPAIVRKLMFQLRLFFLKLRGQPDPRNRFNNFPINRIEADKNRARQRDC